MKTFLDTHIDRSSTFILYGNTNDTIMCGDLSRRTTEQYLVQLLQSRGFKHVLFYGDAGNGGAYCLDPVSARFFFSENAGVPILTNSDAEGPSENSGRPHRVGTASPKDDASLIMGRRRTCVKTAANGADSSQLTSDDAGASNSDASRVVYARKAMELPFFLEFASHYMDRAESKMALVFDNILTLNVYDNAASNIGGRGGSFDWFKKRIISTWEKQRALAGNHNICIMIAPETQWSTVDLMNRISELGLASKFVVTDGDSNCSLNVTNCMELDLPKADEVKSLLRRLAICGTRATGKKVSFSYRQLDEIVTELIWCSRSCDCRGKEHSLPFKTAEYNNQIEPRLEAYIDSHARRGYLELTVDTIDEIWGRQARGHEQLLEKLNRPGWERVYQVVKRAVGECEDKVKRAAKRQKTDVTHAPDWSIERLSTEPPLRSPRAAPPHFALLGNPGTGKSTIARLIGEILQEHGIIDIGSVVEVTRENLTSSFISGVPKATMECVNRADEGVLFIDEAHMLGYKDGGANHEGTGKEVLSTLVAAMTDGIHRFSLVLAGYEDEMRKMLDEEPGLRSRIRDDHIIVIDDYGPDLLKSILSDAIRAEGRVLAPALTEERLFKDVKATPLLCYTTRLFQTRDRRRFGNARLMETIADTVCARAKNGIVSEECFYEIRPDGIEINHSWFEPSDVGNSYNSIVEEIHDRFVGMEVVEKYFSVRAEEIEEALGNGSAEDDLLLRPIILCGEPGTGKTEVARLMGRLFFHLKLLGTPEIIEVNASSLASTLVGGSQEKILELVAEAQDKKALLFVDEAHQLASAGFDGPGALKAMLSPLTNRSRPIMAVFAVYPNEYLKAFLDIDPGSKRRFEQLDLPSYNGDQLYTILHKMMSQSTPTLQADEETDRLLVRVCEEIYRSRTMQTGNAGRMQRLLEEMNALRRDRCAIRGIEMSDPVRYRFVPSDIPVELLRSLPPEDADTEQIMAELDALVGLQNVKKEIESHVDRAKTNKLRVEHGLSPVDVSMHMVFTGNPGTGKTTVARLIGRLFHAAGLLPRGHTVEVDRSKLISSAIGQTAINTKAQVEEAIGGVLFVDEAYELLGRTDANDFGTAAIETLLKAMEDNRDNLVVIAAGYPEPMQRFIASNDGLESRFKTIIEFPNYDADECMQIFDGLCEQDDYRLAEDARGAIRDLLRHEVDSPNFANGRFVRNLYESVINAQSRRVIQIENPTNEDLITLTMEDISSI